MLHAWNVTCKHHKTETEGRLYITYWIVKLKAHKNLNTLDYHLIYIPENQKGLLEVTTLSVLSLPAGSSCPCRSPWHPYRCGQAEPLSLLRHRPQETPPQMETECTCLWRLKLKKKRNILFILIYFSVQEVHETYNLINTAVVYTLKYIRITGMAQQWGLREAWDHISKSKMSHRVNSILSISEMVFSFSGTQHK